MKTTHLSLLCATLLMTGCGNEVGDPNRGPPTPVTGNTIDDRTGEMTVVAGDVIDKGLGMIYFGKFDIRAPVGSERGIANSTKGGACLLARVRGPDPATSPGRLCMRDADCQGHYGTLVDRDQGQLHKGTGHEYCLGHYGDVPSGSCWVKPDDSYCRKGVGEGSWETPQISPAAVREFAQTVGADAKVDWKVLGCLNGPQVGDPTSVSGQLAFPCSLRGIAAPGAVSLDSEGPVLTEQ